MLSGRSFAYYPEKILWYGLGGVSIAMACFINLISLFQADEPVRISDKKKIRGGGASPIVLDFHLVSLPSEKWNCPIPDIQRDMLFSLDPLRPDAVNQAIQISVRLKQQMTSRNFIVPCRIDLAYQEGILTFLDGPSSFWLELTQDQGELQGKVFVDDQSGPFFTLALQQTPVQTAQEFQEGSPFRLLVEGKWWGQDLFFQNHMQGKIIHRIDLGSPLESKLLDLDEKQWLVFEDGHWKVVETLKETKSSCVARMKGVSSSGIEIEGWEESRHVRLCLPCIPLSPFKVKPEELFSSIRIRSDKQISCVLDKQCLILKVNDWVLKVGDRWKILRKAEEKEAFLKGKLVGELFVLTQISNKQGEKSILGRMYSAARTQIAMIDLPVLGRNPASSRTHHSIESKGKLR